MIFFEKKGIFYIIFCVDEFKKHIHGSNNFIAFAIKRMLQKKQKKCSFHFTFIKATSIVVFSIECRATNGPICVYESYIIEKLSSIKNIPKEAIIIFQKKKFLNFSHIDNEI